MNTVHSTSIPTAIEKAVDEVSRTSPKESAARGTHAEIFHLLQEAVPEGRVLDVPCGTGSFLRRLRDHEYEPVGVDVQAQPLLPRTGFYRADMNEPLPFMGDSFDAIVCIEGIEHIRRPWDFVGECRRVLRSRGVFILSTPNISSLRSRWRWFLTGFHNKCKCPLDETRPEPRHHIMMSYPELRYMLHVSGFAIEQVATNRIKPAAWLYRPLAPLQRLLTSLVLPRGSRSMSHADVIRDVRNAMLEPAVLFGETTILLARAH